MALGVEAWRRDWLQRTGHMAATATAMAPHDPPGISGGAAVAATACNAAQHSPPQILGVPHNRIRNQDPDQMNTDQPLDPGEESGSDPDPDPEGAGTGRMQVGATARQRQDPDPGSTTCGKQQDPGPDLDPGAGREARCRTLVESIRRSEFGEGLQLEGEAQALRCGLVQGLVGGRS